MSHVFIGPTGLIAECLFGPRQHDAHCQGWRWHQYISDMNLKERAANVRRAADQIIAEAQAAQE